MAVSESSARRYALDPDVRLMLEVRDDSAVAFEELVTRYQSRIMAVLKHQIGSREQAEDLTQEVFLRMYRARKSYRPEAKFATWLFTIANHLAATALRDRARRREVSLPLRDSGPVGIQLAAGKALQASSGLMPARQLDKAEMRDQVRMALESLPARQRMAVLLNKFEGMSYVDIAAVMELSSQAVKSLLSRAREHLREVLEPYLDRGESPALASGANHQRAAEGEQLP
jgi:RNA polymerase sigma-70 factor (ECF subfamily)